MADLDLKFTNSKNNAVIPFLPYGVTTIEFTAKDNGTPGYIRPKYSTLGEKNKEYVGFANKTRDFLVVWGGGSEEGEYVKKNSTARMFMQLIHLKNEHPDETITFEHTGLLCESQTITISPATNKNCIRMVTSESDAVPGKKITFEGTYMPLYYSRWFPPKPEQIEYLNSMTYPQISIEYSEDENGIVSNSLEIFSEIDNKNELICSVKGDLKYSRPHAELFALFRTKKIIVLRLWLYWIHGRIASGFLDASPSSGAVADSKTLGLFEQGIEVPDIERFDLVLDTTKNRILWCGSDFHYQELWAKPKNPIVEAKIARSVDLFYQTSKLWPLRYLQDSDYYNPIKWIKCSILNDEEEEVTIPLVPQKTEAQELESLGKGFRAHVPYIEECTLGGKYFLSSDSRKGATYNEKL